MTEYMHSLLHKATSSRQDPSTNDEIRRTINKVLDFNIDSLNFVNFRRFAVEAKIHTTSSRYIRCTLGLSDLAVTNITTRLLLQFIREIQERNSSIIMGLLDMLGFGNKSEQIKSFIEKGALIIDVRSPGEFASGHIDDSTNIPLGSISSRIEEIKKLAKPVIVCCASGMRSSQAASILKQNGIEAINGGGWSSLERKL